MSTSLYAEITADIIKQVESGAMPWIKPWKASNAIGSNLDRNIVTQKPYQGINRFLLGMIGMMRGYNTPVWGTFNHWQGLGATIKKGEKGSKIVFFKPVAKGQPDAEGNEAKGYAVLKSYYVFNVDQIDGITIKTQEPIVTKPFDAIEAAEHRIVQTGAKIFHGGDSAYFMPSRDIIQLPFPHDFSAPCHYYATAFHELGHWTSDKARCDRDISKGRFGNPEYAFEELVAELTAAFLCQDYGIAGELRHAGYVANWLKAMREESKAIFKAAALAQKAADYINACKIESELLAA